MAFLLWFAIAFVCQGELKQGGPAAIELHGQVSFAAAGLASYKGILGPDPFDFGAWTKFVNICSHWISNASVCQIQHR